MITLHSSVCVPQVAVRPPGQRQYEWVDLWEAYVSMGAAQSMSFFGFFLLVYHCLPFPIVWEGYLHEGLMTEQLPFIQQ